MGKKIAVGVVILVLVCVGLCFLFCGEETVKGPIVAGGKQQPAVSLEKAFSGSVINDLSKDTALYFTVSTSNFKPAGEYLKKIQANFAKTKAWKKLGIDQQLEQLLKDPFSQAGRQLSPIEQEVKDLLFEAAADLNELGVVVSSKTLAAPQGIKIPMVMLSASFTKEGLPQKVRSFALKQYQQFKEQMGGQTGPLSVVEKGTDVIEVTVKDPQGSFSASALLNTAKDSLQLLLGTNDEKVFFAEGDDRLLVDPEFKSVLQSSVLPDSAINTYIDFATLLPAFQQIIEQFAGLSGDVDAEGLEALKRQVFNNIEGSRSLGASVNFAGGINSRSCLSFDVKSPFGEIYKDFFPDKLSKGAGGLHSLVNPSTMLALKFSGRNILAQASVLKRTYLNKDTWPADNPVAFEEVEGAFNSIYDSLKKMQLQEIGLIVNTSPGQSMPSGGLYMGSSSISGDELLDEIKRMIEALSSGTGAPAKVEKTVNADGGNSLLISLGGPGQNLLIGKVGGNAVFASLQQSAIANAAMQLVGGSQSHISKHFPADAKMDQQLSAFDTWTYLSTASALEMVKGLIPLFAPQVQEKGVEAQEAIELLDLLKTTLFSYQKTYKESDDILCVDSSIQALRRPAGS